MSTTRLLELLAVIVALVTLFGWRNVLSRRNAEKWEETATMGLLKGLTVLTTYMVLPVLLIGMAFKGIGALLGVNPESLFFWTLCIFWTFCLGVLVVGTVRWILGRLRKRREKGI